MMQIVYSVFKETTGRRHSKNARHENEIEDLRLQAYQTVCRKYAPEIQAIQRYMPGWQPEFMLK